MHAIRIPSTKFFYQFIFKNLVEDVSWVFQSKLFLVVGKKSVQSFAFIIFSLLSFFNFYFIFHKKLRSSDANSPSGKNNGFGR